MKNSECFAVIINITDTNLIMVVYAQILLDVYTCCVTVYTAYALSRSMQLGHGGARNYRYLPAFYMQVAYDRGREEIDKKLLVINVCSVYVMSFPKVPHCAIICGIGIAIDGCPY